jgi:hypothetical protein
VVFLKRKIALTVILLLGISFISWIGSTSAQPVIEVWAYTDRAYYEYGDTGTLFIAIRNKGEGDIILKEISVVFPWHGWYHETWDGNFTEQNINEALTEGKFYTHTLSFKVPSESRNKWTKREADIIVKYAFGEELETVTSTIAINIATPFYNESLTAIYYLSGVLTMAVVIVTIELFFIWRRLGKFPASTSAS